MAVVCPTAQMKMGAQPEIKPQIRQTVALNAIGGIGTVQSRDTWEWYKRGSGTNLS